MPCVPSKACPTNRNVSSKYHRSLLQFPQTTLSRNTQTHTHTHTHTHTYIYIYIIYYIIYISILYTNILYTLTGVNNPNLTGVADVNHVGRKLV